MGYYAGVDVGATNVRVVVANGEEIVARDRRPTPHGPTGVAVTEAVLDAIRGACEEVSIEPNGLRAVGIASIGPLDLAEGAIDDPANVPDVGRVPLTGPVENLVDAPVSLHNDADAGVIGERYFGERTPDDLVYLTVSTGIGAGVCVDGRVLSGWDGNAGEIGHLQLDPEERLECGCGKPGHWEAYCSGSNVPRYARYLHETEGVPTDLSLSDLTAEDVFDAEDDPLADLTTRRVGEWNARGVASLVHAYAPLVVYVGGAVALNHPDQILDPVRERLPDLVMSNVPDLQLTSLGEDVVVRGALASAFPGVSP